MMTHKKVAENEEPSLRTYSSNIRTSSTEWLTVAINSHISMLQTRTIGLRGSVSFIGLSAREDEIWETTGENMTINQLVTGVSCPPDVWTTVHRFPRGHATCCLWMAVSVDFTSTLYVRPWQPSDAVSPCCFVLKAYYRNHGESNKICVEIGPYVCLVIHATARYHHHHHIGVVGLIVLKNTTNAMQ